MICTHTALNIFKCTPQHPTLTQHSIKLVICKKGS